MHAKASDDGRALIAPPLDASSPIPKPSAPSPGGSSKKLVAGLLVLSVIPLVAGAAV
jgi:hypothetical protein